MNSGPNKGYPHDYQSLMSDPPRLHAIPQWVFNIIHNQQREVERMEAQVNVEKSAVPSKLSVCLGYQKYMPLPDNAQVTFSFGGHFIEAYLGEHGGLEVRGSRRLTISPEAFNMINVKVEGRE